MEKTSLSDRVAELEKQIRANQELYYNAEPALSDEEFDALWTELEDIDPGNPLLRRVGEDKADGWPKERHIIPMGSQAKATDPESFEAWASKIQYDHYIVQYKLDGASIELQYKEGYFLRAVTRGDGIVGDDITPNAVRMHGVARKLPKPFTGGVRGEVLMSKSAHREKYADKANCRNAANGLMKRKDGLGSEDLDIICYDAMGSENEQPFSNELEKLSWLKEMGFAIVTTEVFSSAKDIVDYRGRIMALRPTMEYDIDGLVVKGLEIDIEDSAKPRPEKQIAFKFSPEEAVTRLKSIEWSESGALYTPIAIVDPVRLAGTTVQRANLCNPDMIRTMGLKLGSLVVITKRGEIIPKIETLVENPDDAVEISQPTFCGACGTKLLDEGTRLYCPNELCPKKELHRLEKWITILDIRDFGSALIRRLHEAGRVKTVADLYSLTVDDLEGIERMGKISAQKVLRNLHAVEEISLASFIAAFDLEGVGQLIAEKLVKGGFSSLDSLLGAREEELITIDGIAETMAATIIKGLSAVRAEMLELMDTGAIRIKAMAEPSLMAESNPLFGKSFCFTGELRSMKRPEAEKKIRELGGTSKSSVTKDLDFLVTNDPASGSGKNKKAKEYGVEVLGEDEFLALLASATANR